MNPLIQSRTAILPLLIPSLLACLAAVFFATAPALARDEVPFNGTNGRRIYDYIFVPVFGADGEVEAVAGTTRDVTERKKYQSELLAATTPAVRTALANPTATPIVVLRPIHLIPIPRFPSKVFPTEATTQARGG